MRRETRGRGLSGTLNRQRRDAILGVIKNAQGDSFGYLNLDTVSIPTVSPPDVTKIELDPITSSPDTLIVPSIPTEGRNYVELMLSFYSAMDTCQDGLFRHGSEMGILNWKPGTVFGCTMACDSFSQRYQEMFLLRKNRYVFF